MTILRSGATEKYSQNWAQAFGGKKARGFQGTKSMAVKSAKKSKPKAKKGKK